MPATKVKVKRAATDVSPKVLLIPVLTVVSVVAQWLISGEFNEAELATAVTGLATAVFAYFKTDTREV